MDNRRVLALTPILSGQILHPEVIQGVASLSIPWLINSAPASLSNVPREVNINANCAQLQQEAREQGLKPYDLVLLLDSDVVINKPIFDRLKASLTGEFICASVDTKGMRFNHTVTACALMEWQYYELIRYWDNPTECQCLKIANLGKILQIDGQIQEIKR